MNQELMLNKKSQPLAYCTRCGGVLHNVQHINQTCPIIRNGKRCNGSIRSATNSKDWIECPSCGATGRIEGGSCDQCAGEGWLLVRKPK